MALIQPAFEFESFIPIPIQKHGVLDNGVADGNALMALDTVAKYLFIDETGASFHLNFVFRNATLSVFGNTLIRDEKLADLGGK